MARRKAIPKDSITGEYFGDFIQVALGESPLPLVLVFTAVLENALMTLLSAFLIKSETTDNMFAPNGELESLSRCSRMAYCLGFISKSSFENLTTIGRIRNLFAHKTKVMDFANSEVVELCKKLTLPPITLPEVMTTIDAKLGPAESHRSKFVEVCWCLISYLLHAATMTERRKLIDDSSVWDKVLETLTRGAGQFQAIVNRRTQEPQEQK